MDRDILAVANVSEVQQIVDAKYYAVILADKKAKVVETVSDLASVIWNKAGGARGVVLPVPFIFVEVESAIWCDTKYPTRPAKKDS
jgi:hypothetical protein